MKESILVNRLLGSGTTTHKCPKSGKHVSGDRVGMSPEFKGKNHGNPRERSQRSWATGVGSPVEIQDFTGRQALKNNRVDHAEQKRKSFS